MPKSHGEAAEAKDQDQRSQIGRFQGKPRTLDRPVPPVPQTDWQAGLTGMPFAGGAKDFACKGFARIHLCHRREHLLHHRKISGDGSAARAMIQMGLYQFGIVPIQLAAHIIPQSRFDPRTHRAAGLIKDGARKLTTAVAREDVDAAAGYIPETATGGTYFKMRFRRSSLLARQSPFMKVGENARKVSAVHNPSNRRPSGRLVPQEGQFMCQLYARSIGARLDCSDGHMEHSGNILQSQSLDVF